MLYSRSLDMIHTATRCGAEHIVILQAKLRILIVHQALAVTGHVLALAEHGTYTAAWQAQEAMERA